MVSSLLGLPGAVGETTAVHYGNPLGEQRKLAEGRAVVDLGDYDVITLTGPDRLIWLNSISSQDFLGLRPGDTVESLILDPNGHVEHRFLAVDDATALWLLVEPGAAEALVAWLTRMRFRMQVDIDVVSEHWSALGAIGDYPIGPATGRETATTAAESTPVVWNDPWPSIQPGAVGYGPEPHPGADLRLKFWLHPREALSPEDYPEWAGSAALDALLVYSARPTLRGEVDEKLLPHEVDWIRTAIHLEKGCYRGQETVAKVHNLGHPPRRVVLLHLDGSGGELPEAGSAVSLGEKTVGHVTRAVRHFEWGPIALALVKRTTDTEAELDVAGPDGAIVATQQVLVPQDAGATRREAIRQIRTGG